MGQFSVLDGGTGSLAAWHIFLATVERRGLKKLNLRLHETRAASLDAKLCEAR